jgi:hypothetical protein
MRAMQQVIIPIIQAIMLFIVVMVSVLIVSSIMS